MKILNFQPVYLSNAAANILNCNTTSLAGPVGYTPTQDYLVVKHIRLINTDSAAHTVTLYKGATGGSTGGTEFGFKGFSIPANSYVDWYGEQRFDVADFLTGLADAANVVTINIGAKLYIV